MNILTTKLIFVLGIISSEKISGASGAEVNHPEHHHSLLLDLGQFDDEHEKAHMKEHVRAEDAFLDLDKLDHRKLMLQYFRNFDLNNDWRLDGLELLKSRTEINDAHENEEVLELNDLEKEVDVELAHYDENNDGLVTVMEFMKIADKQSNHQ